MHQKRVVFLIVKVYQPIVVFHAITMYQNGKVFQVCIMCQERGFSTIDCSVSLMRTTPK